MHQRKSKIILIYCFLLIIFSSISNNALNILEIIKIQNIKISGLDQKDNQIILNKLRDLNLENIFNINKYEIEKLLNSNSLIESYKVFKEYPSTINIDIKKTSFLAKLNNNGKIFLIGSNGKLTLERKLHNDLPYIFGKPNIEDFLELKKILEKSKFSYNQIESFYFYPSQRWDLKLKENILLKLPNNFTNELLDNLYKFIEKYNLKNSTVIDARVKNQIILNE